MAYTPESVKLDLPTVDVRVHAGVLKGQLSGRLGAFARVTIRPDGAALPTTFECAWVTIADCLNRGIAIRA